MSNDKIEAAKAVYDDAHDRALAGELHIAIRLASVAAIGASRVAPSKGAATEAFRLGRNLEFTTGADRAIAPFRVKASAPHRAIVLREAVYTGALATVEYRARSRGYWIGRGASASDAERLAGRYLQGAARVKLSVRGSSTKRAGGASARGRRAVERGAIVADQARLALDAIASVERRANDRRHKRGYRRECAKIAHKARAAFRAGEYAAAIALAKGERLGVR